jgi:hypothetical protein
MRNIKGDMKSGEDYFNIDKFKLTDTQKNSIKNYIKNSGMQLGGTSYNIIDPILRKYTIYIYVKMKSKKYESDSIKSQIKKLVGDFFSNITSDIYIPKSDISLMLKNNINEIDGVDIYFISERNEKAIYDGEYINSIYFWNPSKEAYDVKYERVRVHPDENPNLGLDEHGNIYLDSNDEFPILRGWTGSDWYSGNFDHNKFIPVPADGIMIIIE